MHRQIRKVDKTKGAFTSDQALLKLIYLAIQNISKKWTMPIRNWGPLTQFALYCRVDFYKTVSRDNKSCPINTLIIS